MEKLLSGKDSYFIKFMLGPHLLGFIVGSISYVKSQEISNMFLTQAEEDIKTSLDRIIIPPVK